MDMSELNEEEQNDLHITYWASFYGLTEYVRWILVANQWSPFIKAYKKQSILAGAICGKQIETAEMILSYSYEPNVQLKEN